MIKFKRQTGCEIIPVPKSIEEDSVIPAYLPQSNVIFIAPSFSGKSTLILNMLLRKAFHYQQHYDKIYLISPSIHMDSSFDILHNEIQNQADKRERMYNKFLAKRIRHRDIPKKFYPDNHKFFIQDEYDETYIQDIVDNKDPKDKVLFILDDVADSLKRHSEKSVLPTLFMRGRHNKCWVWLSTQNYTSVVPQIRKNSPGFIIFKVNNKELEHIAKEIHNGDIQHFKDIYKACVSSKFGFLYVNMKSEQKYTKNFSHFIECDE